MPTSLRCSASSERVRAFRSRLAEGDFRRVQGYIPGDDKARLDRLRAELGVTADAAVAGLLRLGLSAYEEARARPVPGAHAPAPVRAVAQFFRSRPSRKETLHAQ